MIPNLEIGVKNIKLYKRISSSEQVFKKLLLQKISETQKKAFGI